ncbi:MAG: heme-binding beta-barrel domain-containing protein [Pseudomonadales bacterium]
MSNSVIDGIDYGPLALLLGTWKGDKGMDIAPEPDGTTEENPFYEEIVFEAAGDVDNADKQNLAAIRYHQQVYRQSNDKQFHDQVGYWLWDAAANIVMLTISIPRGVTLVAGGPFDPASIKDDSALLRVASEIEGDWGIAQSPFMKDNAKTTGFKMNLKVDADKMSYSQTTFLDIYGKAFDHTDKSSLTRIS